jgi:hypothetical protein
MAADIKERIILDSKILSKPHSGSINSLQNKLSISEKCIQLKAEEKKKSFTQYIYI